MGADRRSFPYVDVFHGPRTRAGATWQKDFREEIAQPGVWTGPWPPGVHECEEARQAPRPNVLRVYCNKCKELVSDLMRKNS